MPAGANAKREREFDELVRSFRAEGRYPGREEEVAARIVNKQRRQFRETQAARTRDAQGRSPDRALPIAGYEHLTIREVAARLSALSRRDLERLRAYEAKHKRRKGMLERLDRALAR